MVMTKAKVIDRPGSIVVIVVFYCWMTVEDIDWAGIVEIVLTLEKWRAIVGIVNWQPDPLTQVCIVTLTLRPIYCNWPLLTVMTIGVVLLVLILLLVTIWRKVTLLLLIDVSIVWPRPCWLLKKLLIGIENCWKAQLLLMVLLTLLIEPVRKTAVIVLLIDVIDDYCGGDIVVRRRMTSNNQ